METEPVTFFVYCAAEDRAMSVMDHDQQPRSGGMGKFLVIGAAAIAVLAVAYFGVTMMMRPEAKPEPAPAARTEPAACAAGREAGRAGEARRAPAARRPRPRKEAPPAPEPAAPPPAGPTLVVESDVPGASVFIDRKFVGMTPLRTTDVAGGPHQLNASVTGEEGLAQTIDIAGTGETTIALKFKEVRLNAIGGGRAQARHGRSLRGEARGHHRRPALRHLQQEGRLRDPVRRPRGRSRSTTSRRS